ncbi:OrNV gp035-like protein [Tomelloso virus]|uniref:OrNV gp035-like protein n=1 Tax=Tomelloso virus TaxID=2053981 RepID=A0A2H4T2W2_9VIRU|nr:OrNV gp035-like protein [Tomelloso virus]ATY70264.1 OrNV gp035-like protein [Tomelloso virus]
MALTAQELLQFTLDNQATQDLIDRYAIDISKYLNIIIAHNIGSDIYLNTYYDYLNATPVLFSEFQPYISSSEYSALLICKPQIDYLVHETFKGLV